jgi:hypothetical protein
MKHTNKQAVSNVPPYPEVLPWFARRAGISEARAKTLWDLTCQELSHSDDAQWLAKARMTRFIERLGDEAGLPITPDYTAQPDKLSWLCRHYGRLTDMALISGGAITRFWQQAMTSAHRAR